MLSYLKELKIYLYITTLLFGFAFLMGIFFPNLIDVSQIIEFIIRKTTTKNLKELVIFIILTNLRTAFLSILLGIIIIIPILITLFNGYLLGSVLIKQIILSNIFISVYLLPHGIFELPAMLISFSLGMKIGTTLFKKDKIKNLVKEYKKSFILFIFIIMPLLLIAGIIEALFIYTK